MKRILQASIVFVAAIMLFVTVPTLKNIYELSESSRAIRSEELPGELSVSQKNSYEIHDEVERLIGESGLQKASLHFHTQKFDYLNRYEYELELLGENEQIIRFLEKLSELEASAIHEIMISEAPDGSQASARGLYVKIVFIGA